MPKSKHQIPGRVRSAYELIKSPEQFEAAHKPCRQRLH